MFEWNGQQFTLDQVLKSAEEAGLSFEEYKEKYGIIEVEDKEPVSDFQYDGKSFTFDQVDNAAKEADLSFNDYVQTYGIETPKEVEVVGERYPKAEEESKVPYAPQEEIVGPSTQPQEWLKKQKTDLLDYEENLIPEAEELFSPDWVEDNQVYVPSASGSPLNPGASYVKRDPENEGRTEAIEEAKKLLNEQNGGTNLVEPSEEEILETAKNIWLNKKQENLQSGFADSFLRRLDKDAFDWSDPQTYASMVSPYIKAPLNPETKAFKERQATLTEGDKKFTQEKVQKNKLDLNKLSTKVKTNELQAINLAQGDYKTQEDLDEAKKQIANIALENEAIIEKSKYIFDDLKANSKEIGKYDEYLDVIKRDYSFSGIALGSLTASTIELVNGGLAIPRYLKTTADNLAKGITGNKYDMPDWVFALAGPAFNLLASEETKDVNGFLDNVSENIRGTFAKNQEVTDIDSLGGVASWIAQLIGNQTPIMATMMSMPTYSLTVLGASAAGGKFLEMEKEMGLPGGPTYSGLELLLAPAIVGGAEYLSEKITLGQVKGVMKAVKGDQSIIEAVKRYLTNDYLRWTKDMFQEGGSEVAATLAENMTDKYLLDKDVELTRGLADSFASGAVMSGFIYKVPLAGRALSKVFWGEDVRNQIQTGNQLIKELNNELNNDNLTETERKDILNNIAEIDAKQKKIMRNANESFDNATTTEKKRLFKIYDLQNNIKRRVIKIANNTKLSEKNRKKMIDIQQRKWDGYQDEKNSILIRLSEKNFDPQTFSIEEYENNVTKGKMGRNEYIDKQIQTLSNTLLNLQERRKKATTAEEIKLLDLKIKNVQNKIKYLVPEKSGFFSIIPTTIRKANSIKELNQAFITKSAELSDALKSKKITPTEYNKQYKRLKTIFDKKRNSFIEKVDKTKGEYTELQKLYDSTIDKEGKLPTTQRGENKFVNEFNKIAAPIFEKIAQRLYDRTPKNKLGTLTREDFIRDLQSAAQEMIKGEEKSKEKFDPSLQTLDKFISNRLNLRANRLIDQATGKNNEFTEELTDKISQTIIEEIEEENEANKIIETSKLLDLPKNITKKLKASIPTILSTLKSKIDSRKFKGEISKAFKDLLYGDLKEFFGKDKKGNKRFTDFITKNTKALYDTLTVESMRMARNNKTGINPFVEAGFLIEKNGELVKAAFETIDQQAFIDYYTAKDKAANTMSDRRMNLIEAVASSIGAAEAINALTTDADIKNKFLEQQTKELEKAAKGLSLLESYARNIFQKITKKIEKEFARYGFTRWSTLALTHGFNDINLNNAKEREAFLENLVKTGLTKLLPASLFRSFQGVSKPKIFVEADGLKYVKNLDGELLLKKTYETLSKKQKKEQGFGRIERDHDRHVFFKNAAEADAWIKEVGIENFAKDPIIDKALKKSAYTSEIKGKTVLTKVNWKEEDNKLVALEKIFDIFQEYMLDNGKVNKKNASIVSALLKSSPSWQGHFIRKLAPRGFTNSSKLLNDLGNRLFVEEHTLPASAVAKYLFEQAINGTVKNNFDLIKKNYFQGPLLKTSDDKLAGIGVDGRPFTYKESTPSGWMLTDNIWARYFNANVNNTRGGIDPNAIILRNGKTVAQEFNVQSDGTITPDVKQLQQEGIAEQTGDQVENLLDRAIAKLTELTGSQGTLQMNLAAVPVHLLAGGLRAVKLAYQGGKSLSQAINAGYNKIKNYMTKAEWAEFVGVSVQEIRNEKNPAQVKLAILSEKGVAQMQEQSRKTDNALLKEFGINIDGLSTDQIVEKLNILRKAKSEASNPKNPTKKARVFDFDDTLAKTNSKVLYTLPDGTEGSLNATEFAEQYESLKESGATFDYSEFNKVKDGTKGPLATLAKRFTEALGDRDVFVLTARPAEAAAAIQEFLRNTLNISIPLKNISGIENGTPGAKAMWIAEKVSEGYNDVFFADDSKTNVEAVEKMLTDLGVTNRVQQAKEDGQKTLEDEMDSLIRTNKPSKLGRILNKFNIYIPPGADDFAGLLSYFLGSGKIGEQQQKWFQENLLDPFAKGIDAWTAAKVSLAEDYKALKKRFKNKKLLAEKVLGGLYTKEQAVRAYLYNKAGQDLGLNKADTEDLIALVEGDAKLKAFAEELSKITKLDNGYPNITKEWLGGNIDTDIANAANTSLRDIFLQDFINNKNQIFSPQNLKLIQQAYGNDFTNALENILERMTTGINRKKGKDKEFNAVMTWINQSVGAVMAINMRSAILQQLSIVNYTNWSFNNPFMMAKAMANVPQFLKDYIKIWNSPFLKERRGGMAIEVNMADIADSNPSNLFLKLNKKLLELGFKPTQWGDSNAISFGGATWYRNRLNQLLKEGTMTEKEADAQVMLELRELSEEHQQSSRPDRISRQQSSDIGRLILAFANTPLQLARSHKKAIGNLIYRRGDAKTNMSKAIYYGMAQSLIFVALQQGLFSLLADDDDELDEKEKRKLDYALHGVIDGLLRGIGFAGATTAALKSLAMEYYSQYQKRKEGKYIRDGSLKLIQRGLSISPPISKKIGDIVEAQKFETWRQYKNDPFYKGFAVANYVSGLTNVPADRIFKKIENLKAASDDRTEAWQSIFLSLGWSPYNVGVQWPEIPPKKTKKKSTTSKKKVKKKKVKKKKSPIKMELPQGVLGRANKDGTIEIKKGLSKEKEAEVEAHEEAHLLQFKTGKLDYNDEYIRWKNQQALRTADSKIFWNGKLYKEGDRALPWEIEANKLSKQRTV